jgi:hypothetical protein
VRVGDRALGFLAPKFHGKSTLAYALVAAGAGSITDDTLPVELRDPSRVPQESTAYGCGRIRPTALPRMRPSSR